MSIGYDVVAKFVKFAFVGASGVVVDFSVTYLLKEKLGVQKYVANGVGFMVAATSNYALNRIWTFKSHSEVAPEYIEFLGVSLIGLIINSFILYLLVKKMNMKFYVAKGIATLVVMLWNFMINYFFTFAK